MSERLQSIAIAAIIALTMVASAWAWTAVPDGTLQTIQLNLAGAPDRFSEASQSPLFPFCHL